MYHWLISISRAGRFNERAFATKGYPGKDPPGPPPSRNRANVFQPWIIALGLPRADCARITML